MGYIDFTNHFWQLYQISGFFLVLIAANALGIEAASFWSAAEKDIAESPTAIAGTPKTIFNSFHCSETC